MHAVLTKLLIQKRNMVQGCYSYRSVEFSDSNRFEDIASIYTLRDRT